MIRIRNINFKRGSGEVISLCVIAVLMGFLLINITAIIQFRYAVNDITQALEVSARAASLCGNIDDAKEQALRVAEVNMTDGYLSGISVSIDPATDDGEWVCGNYFYVTVSATVKTMEPYFTSGRYGKKTLICVENKAPDKLRGDTYAEQIFNYLVDNGFSKAAAAGVVGNVAQECGGTTLEGINPASQNIFTDSAGIVQWRPASEKIKAEAANEGMDWTELSFQLQYLVAHISDLWYGVISTQTKEYVDAGVVEAGITAQDFMQMTDPSEAARVFCAYFEQCHYVDANLDSKPLSGNTREDNARRAYELWK